MFLTDTDIQRPCQRCHDAEAVVVIDTVPGAAPIRETGELCPACVVAVVGTAPVRTDPIAELQVIDPAERLRRIEWTRHSLGEDLDALRRRTVSELRRRGWSWRKIGDAGGVTRARAQQLGRRSISSHTRSSRVPGYR